MGAEALIEFLWLLTFQEGILGRLPMAINLYPGAMPDYRTMAAAMQSLARQSPPGMPPGLG